jgi:threonine aldolase
MLCSYEGVIAADTGHVSLHEAGAIEFTGHKVIALPQKEGKLAAKTVKEYLVKFHGDDSKDHMVFPGMVYISHPTEYGTLYSKAELVALRALDAPRALAAVARRRFRRRKSKPKDSAPAKRSKAPRRRRPTFEIDISAT